MKKLLIIALGALAVGANAQITINASSVAYTDISTSGTSVGTISDDSETTITGAALTTAGWAGNELLAGGVSIRVGNNGGLLWGNSATDTFLNADQVGYYNAGPNNAGATSIAAMPAANGASTGNGGSGARQFLMPLWDDYTPVSSTVTSIRWQVIANDLYISWIKEDAFAAAGAGDVTFQAVIRGGVTIASGSALVDFVYQDTQFQALQYQNDGGSATIGYKNWGLVAAANDVEYGIGGGGTSSLSDPAYNGLGMQPKVAGWVAADNNALTHSVTIQGVPEPGTMAALGLGAIAVIRKRRKSK